MRHVIFVILAAHMSILTSRLLAGDQPVTGDELTTLKRDYADVLALQGTAKAELLAIAAVLRANPEMAIDKTKAAGEDASRAVRAPWFTTRRSPRPQRKTWSTNSTPPSFSQPGLTPSECQSFQPWATWNPVNGISSRVGSSTLTISMLRYANDRYCRQR